MKKITISNRPQKSHAVIYDEDNQKIIFKSFFFKLNVEGKCQLFLKETNDVPYTIYENAHYVNLDIECVNGIRVEGSWVNTKIFFKDTPINMVKSLEISGNNNPDSFVHVILNMATNLPSEPAVFDF